MEKFVQSALANIVKLTPSGIGLAVTFHAITEREWVKSILLTFVTACSVIWVKFSGKFMEEAGKEAEERGGGLAKWLFAMGDRTANIGQKSYQRLISDFENKYYQRLVSICCNYETQGLDQEQALKLQHVFVSLKIATKSLTQISPDLIQKLPEKISNSQDISKLLVKMKNDPAFYRFAILGGPGTGKTTLLRYLTLSCASRQQRKSIDSKTPKFIPVLIYLRDFRQDIIRNERLNLIDLINIWIQRLQTTDPLVPPPNWFDNKLKNKECLILLDGLDEIANENERKQVSRWVDRQMYEYQAGAFILTSRPLGYEKAKLQQDSVTILEVQPFTFSQVKKFIQKWYLQTEIRNQGNDDLEVGKEAKRRADDLINRIRDNPSLRMMTGNPLLLTMISTVHCRGNALPEKRVELYKEICQVLLDKRPQAKDIPNPFTIAQIQSVLQKLALNLMQQGERSFTLSVINDLLQGQAEIVCPQGTDSEKFLKQIQEVSGLLSAKEENLYEFVHLSFQEYLAAMEIKKLNKEQILINALLDQKQISWWLETTRLYSAQEDASRIIRAAMQAATVDTLALAFDCLEESPSEKVNPIIRQELEDFLNEGLEDRSDNFKRVAEVLLRRRLNKRFYPLGKTAAIDSSYITCAEYQLFIDEQRAKGQKVQPDHWKAERFSPGTARHPITGVRARHAEKFCQWLTQRQQSSVFYYRLPTSSEADEYPGKSQDIGYWCCDDKNIFKVYVDQQQRKVWKEQLWEQMKQTNPSIQDLDLNHAIEHILDTDLDYAKGLVKKTNFNLAFKYVQDLEKVRALKHKLADIRRIISDLRDAQELEDQLSHNFSSNFTRKEEIKRLEHESSKSSMRRLHELKDEEKRERECRQKRDRLRQGAQARASRLGFYDSIDLESARKLGSDCHQELEDKSQRVQKNSLALHHEPEYIHTQEFDSILATSYKLKDDQKIILGNNIDTEHKFVADYRKIRNYIFKFMNFCSSLEQTSRSYNKHNQLSNLRDLASQLYCFFSLLDFQQQGRVPVWTSICIVRECNDD